MLAYIKGQLEAVGEDHIVVEAGHIGYQILVPASMFNELPPKGDDLKVYTYLHVREDAMTIFGFMTKDDVDVFKKLITVNGIGPKGAMGVLSTLSAYELRIAVMAGDVKTISTAPGIGKKTAQKLILDLKDKLKIEDVSALVSDEINGNKASVTALTLSSEAVEALVALGYSNHEALMAVKGLSELNNVEDIIKAALKKLAIL